MNADTTLNRGTTLKLNLFAVAKCAGIFLILFLAANVRFLGTIEPCFYGMFLSFMFLGGNFFYLSVAYFLASLVGGVSVNSLIFSLICCVVGSFINVFCKKKAKKIPSWISCLTSIAIGVPYIFLLTPLGSIYVSAVNVILNTIFMLCATNFFKVAKARSFNLNLNTDEIVCGCLVLAFLFCGIENLNVFYFNITKLIGVFCILMLNAICKNQFSVILSIVMGLGVALAGGDLSFITLFGLTSIFCYIFKGYSKIYSVIMALLVDLAFSLFFSSVTFSFMQILPSIIAGSAFFALPQSLTEKIKNSFFSGSESDSLKNILNQNKLQVSKRLSYTAEVFYEMDKNFRSLVKGGLDVAGAKVMICNELIKANCEGCPNRTKCLKGFNSELKKVFEGLVNVGFEKGRVTLIDLPTYLTNRCGKLNQVVGTLNALLKEYKNYTKIIGNLDASKVLIAEQLGGISHILQDLSDETRQTVAMDYKTEKSIKENLIYNDIVPNEVVCFEKDENTNIVSLIIRTSDFENEKIVKVLNKVCPSKMILDEILPNVDSNLTYLSYKTAPTYDIAVGIAQSSKGGEEVCGDTHAESKLIGDKFMFALCDGMGHGKTANKASDLSISLIENFYKAGFDNQTILTSVNKLLNLGREDIFSALDVSVVDLKSGEVDFIKQGATIGFVKKGEEVSKIESNSLPIGILDEVKPRVTKTVLSQDDVVIMLSDGVVDAFGEEEKLSSYLRTLPNGNPQEMAEKILNRAKRQQNNYPQDDMTVIVGRLFYNCA